MRTSTLRVRKVTFRDGRTIERLPGGRGRDEIRDKLIEHARIIADPSDRTRMDGFAIVAWFSDGSRNGGYRIRRDAAINETAMPSYVHDVLMRMVCDPREE